MEAWYNFFAATAGAAATLTGLIFVGISINLTKIISIPRLPGRAFLSLILLLSVLITSCLCLVPAQSVLIAGIEFLIIGVIIWPVALKIDLNIMRQTEAPYKKLYGLNILFTQVSVLPYIIAGVTILCCGSAGIYWLIPGFIFSFLKAVIDAWVLVVEINR